MKNLKLIFNIVFLVVGIWLLRNSYIESKTETEKSTENHEFTPNGDNKEVDDMVKAVLSDDVIVEHYDGEDKKDYKNGVEVNDMVFTSGNSFYEKTGAGVEVTIPVPYTAIIELDELSTGEHDLADMGNALNVYDGEKFVAYNEGTVTVAEISDGKISGSFRAGNVAGRFTGAVPPSGTLKGQTQIIKTNYLSIKNDGTVERKLMFLTFSYDDSGFKLELKSDEGNKTIDADVENVTVTPTAVTLKADDDDIEYVMIDKLNRDQVTIQYKNGNSIVLL